MNTEPPGGERQFANHNHFFRDRTEIAASAMAIWNSVTVRAKTLW